MAALPRKLLTAYCTFFCDCLDILLALCCSSCLLGMFSVLLKEVMMLSPAGDVLNTNDKGVIMSCAWHLKMLMMLLPAGELLYADNRDGVQRSGFFYSGCQRGPGGAVETPSSSNSLWQYMMLARWACGGHFLRSIFFNRRVGGRA